MSDSGYRLQLADGRYPELASTFICAAILADAIGRRDEAGWSLLHAAWVLDDTDQIDLARSCRRRAADTFISLLSEGKPFAQQGGASEAIVVDCLRRTGRHEEARQLIDRTLAMGLESIIQKILLFQRDLVTRGDAAIHTIEEALEHLDA